MFLFLSHSVDPFTPVFPFVAFSALFVSWCGDDSSGFVWAAVYPPYLSLCVFGAASPRAVCCGSQHIDVCCGVRSVCVPGRARVPLERVKQSSAMCVFVFLESADSAVSCPLCGCMCVYGRAICCDSSQSVVYSAALQMRTEPRRMKGWESWKKQGEEEGWRGERKRWPKRESSNCVCACVYYSCESRRRVGE